MVAEALDPGPMKSFYQDITRSESRHHVLFYHVARQYFDIDVVDQRQDELLEREADVLKALPIRAESSPGNP